MDGDDDARTIGRRVRQVRHAWGLHTNVGVAELRERLHTIAA